MDDDVSIRGTLEQVAPEAEAGIIVERLCQTRRANQHGERVLGLVSGRERHVAGQTTQQRGLAGPGFAHDGDPRLEEEGRGSDRRPPRHAAIAIYRLRPSGA